MARGSQRNEGEGLGVPGKPHAKKGSVEKSNDCLCLARAAASPAACPLLSHLSALPPNYTLSFPGRGRVAAGRVLLGTLY